MRDFFKGWKRKTGTATLLLALVFAGTWVRSHSAEDEIRIRFGFSSHYLTSEGRGLGWRGILHEDWIPIHKSEFRWNSRAIPPPPPPGTLSLIIGGGQRIEGDRHFDLGFIPHWLIVVPLTLLSACLLLGKPRPANQVSRDPQRQESRLNAL
jgi:hypothetical protein